MAIGKWLVFAEKWKKVVPKVGNKNDLEVGGGGALQTIRPTSSLSLSQTQFLSLSLSHRFVSLSFSFFLSLSLPLSLCLSFSLTLFVSLSVCLCFFPSIRSSLGCQHHSPSLSFFLIQCCSFLFISLLLYCLQDTPLPPLSLSFIQSCSFLNHKSSLSL